MTSNAQDFGSGTGVGSILESINKTLYTIAERDTTFLKRFLTLTPETPCTSFHHDFLNRPLVNFKDNLNAAYNNSVTTIVVKSGTSTNPKRYIANQTILDVDDERMLVTAVTPSTTTTSLTVTRGVDGTTAVSHLANAQVLIVSAPPQEGADVTRDDSQKAYRLTNYTQIFQRSIQLSGTAQAVKTAGNEASLDLQARDMMSEIMKELEFTCIHGQRSIDNTNLNRRMGGLKYFATSSGTNTNKNGALISSGIIEDVMEQYLNFGGDANKLMLLCSVKQQRSINALKIARVINGGQTQAETNINNVVNRYDFGDRAQANIMYSTDLRDDEVYFFQEDKFEVKPLAGRQYKREPLAKTGDSDREIIIGEYTCEYRNPTETLIRLYGLGLPVAS